MSKVTVDNMANEIQRQLGAYSKEVTDEIKKTVDEVSKDCLQEIKSHITFNDKNYSKNMAIKKVRETETSKENVWYVKPPYYRLTHLLEYGHATRNGGSTRAFEHIKFGEELIERDLPKKVEEILNNAN